MRAIAALLALWFSVVGLPAAPLVTTLDKTPSGYVPLQAFDWFGFSFSTDDSDYSLESVTAELNVVNSGNFSVSLYAVSGGTPSGSAIASTTPAVLSGPETFADYTFTFGPSVQLSANTTYAIVFQPQVGSFNLAVVPAIDGYTGPGGMPTGLIYSGTAGNSWTTMYDGQVRATIAVNATAIPEPSTAILSLLGVAVLLRARRMFLS